MNKTFALSALIGLSLTSFAFVSPQAWAGGRSDGGGNVVVCFKTLAQKEKVQRQGYAVEDDDLGNIDSIDLLEIFDIKNRNSVLSDRALVTVNGPSEISEAKRIFQYYERAISFSNADSFSSSFNQVIQALQSNYVFADRPLRRQYDSKEAINYDSRGRCLLTTIAMQAGNKQFFEMKLDGRLWRHPKFSLLNKVAVIFHETTYKMDREVTQTDDSLQAQRTTQLLLSKVDGEKRSDWLGKIKAYGILSGSSPDVMFAKSMFGVDMDGVSHLFHLINGWYAYAPGYVIPTNFTNDNLANYHNQVSKYLTDSRDSREQFKARYTITPGLTQKFDNFFEGLLQTTVATHNSYVYRSLECSADGNNCSVVRWMKSIPNVDQFPPM
jgi:hypothetical protein